MNTMKMNYSVSNGELSVGNLTVLDIAASSVLLIGETKSISLSSWFDTPPESVIVGVTVPLAAPE
jgi:spore germination protein PD